MGFMDKIKNLFTEEVEVEETPIKKEVMQVEIPAPSPREEVKTRDITENETLRREEKLRTPVFFDDKDFVNLEQPKPVEKPKPKAAPAPVPKKETYMGGKKEEKKKFAPSPIISPVYGVLDKNYHKEDISDKGTTVTRSHTSRALTVDDVRKKAYGTLEDDLENTMFNNSILFNDETEVEEIETLEEEPIMKEKDIFDELDMVDHETIEVKTEEPKTRVEKNAKIDELSGLELDVTDEGDLLDEDFSVEPSEPQKEEEENMVAEELNKLEDSKEELDLKESDLFQLIDSMYEKRDDE